MTTQFEQFVSWDGTGLFTADGSDVTLLIRPEALIRWTRGLDQARQFEPPKIGTESFQLHNADRRFSPGNMASSLYGQVLPNKKVRLSTAAGASTSFEFMDGEPFEFMDGEPMTSFPLGSINLFTGLTDDFQHNSAFGEKTVDVFCMDMFIRLSDKELSTALYSAIRIDEAIEVILDAIGWPAGDRLLDVATQTLDLWWLSKANAFTAISTLVATEGAAAFFYCDGDGNFVFKNAVALITDAESITSQAVFSDTENAAVESYNDQFKNVIQAAQIVQQERASQGLDTVWSYDGELILGASESVTLIVSNSEPFQNAVEPSLVGINAEQLLTPSVPLTSGTFIANVNGVDTSTINWNASLATIQTAFDGAAGAGNTMVAGSLATALRVQFIGDLAGREISLITIVSSLNTGSAPATVNIIDTTDGANQTYQIFPSAPLSAGTFKIRIFNLNTTTAIDFNAADSLIQSRLEAVPLIDPGDVSVSGGDIDTDTLTIEYQGALASMFVATSIVEASTLRTSTGATATLIVTETRKGGGPDVIISAGDATFSFPERDSGADVPMLITAGASGATLMNLKVRAELMPVVRSRTVTYPTTATLPDGQIYKPTVRQEMSFAAAEALVFDLYTRYHDSRPTENIVLKTDVRTATLFDVLQYGIGWRVTVIGAQNGINAAFHIQAFEHVLDWQRQILTSTFACAQV